MYFKHKKYEQMVSFCIW